MANSNIAWKVALGLCILTFAFEQKKFVIGQAVSYTASGNNNDQQVYGNSVGAVNVMELCNVDLAAILPPPYTNLSDMQCSPIWNSFVLRHSQSEGNVMTIVVSAAYTSGWVGIGFSKDGLMVGSSAMVGWSNPKGNAKINQYYLQGTQSSQVIPDKGELPLTNLPASVILSGAYIYLAFQIKLDNPIARQPIILAVGSRYPSHKLLTPHDDKTSITFNLSKASVASSNSASLGKMKRNHGVLGIIGWGVLIPIGAIIARYFKHKDPQWYYLHIVVQFTGFMVGVGAVIVGQQLYTLTQADIPQHRGIGIFVLVMSILQVVAFFLQPGKESKIRRYWNWYHQWMGRMVIFFGALNVALGIQVGNAGDEWKIGQGFLVCVSIVAVVILEALLQVRKSEKASQPQTFQPNSAVVA